MSKNQKAQASTSVVRNEPRWLVMRRMPISRLSIQPSMWCSLTTSRRMTRLTRRAIWWARVRSRDGWL